MTGTKWQLVVCGVNHKCAPLEEREPLQIGTEELPRAVARLGTLPGVLESVIVSTCNRVEFYMVLDESRDPLETVGRFYEGSAGRRIDRLKGNFYVRREREAAAHLFRVAAGLDSLVVGENQIVGQLKSAYSSSCAVKGAGKVIHRLFHQAFRVGKAVRSDTAMGRGACSVSGACAALLKPRMALVPRPAVLFVGVNQMIDLAASYLSKFDCGRTMFANRTREKAVELAGRYGGTGHGLDELPALLAAADFAVTCTGAPHAVIDEPMILGALAARQGRKLTIMDMAVPRDVDYGGPERPDLEIIDMDRLKSFVESRQQEAAEAVPEAEAIVAQKLNEFMYWYGHVVEEPIYNNVEARFEAIRREEFGPLIERLDPPLQGAVEMASRRLVNRLMQIKIRTESH